MNTDTAIENFREARSALADFVADHHILETEDQFLWYNRSLGAMESALDAARLDFYSEARKTVSRVWMKSKGTKFDLALT